MAVKHEITIDRKFHFHATYVQVSNEVNDIHEQVDTERHLFSPPCLHTHPTLGKASKKRKK